MRRKSHVRFGGGRLEKYPQRQLASRLPYYAGSGPADLALAILADYFEEPPEFVLAALRSMWTPRSKAAALHQSFKEAFVAIEQRDEWELHSDDIEAWLQTPANQTRLDELAQEEGELAEIRRLEEESERADAGVAD
jgi:hypothetical protein